MSGDKVNSLFVYCVVLNNAAWWQACTSEWCMSFNYIVSIWVLRELCPTLYDLFTTSSNGSLDWVKQSPDPSFFMPAPLFGQCHGYKFIRCARFSCSSVCFCLAANTLTTPSAANFFSDTVECILGHVSWPLQGNVGQSRVPQWTFLLSFMFSVAQFCMKHMQFRSN